MAKFLKRFQTTAQYNAYAAGADFLTPNVSLCDDDPTVVHYNPHVEPSYNGFCRLTLSNGNTVELEGSGEVTYDLLEPYTSLVTKAEIGPLCTSVGEWSFNGCGNLTSVTIANTVTNIDNAGFRFCSNLTSIVIPDSVESIGDESFFNCDKLTSIVFGSGLTSIGESAFENCSGFTSVEIPSGTTFIDNYAFLFCYSLASVTVNATTPPTLGGSAAFSSNASGRKIYVPSASVDTYKAATNWSTYASDIEPIS